MSLGCPKCGSPVTNEHKPGCTYASADVLSLSAARAHKAKDCRQWTVADALRDAIADVESGRIKADKVYVAFVVRNDDGSTRYPYTAAGLSRLEVAGLLAMHLADNSR